MKLKEIEWGIFGSVLRLLESPCECSLEPPGSKRHGKPAGKEYLGRPRRKWEGNIIMTLKIGINTRNWVDSAMVRDYWRVLVNAILNLRVP